MTIPIPAEDPRHVPNRAVIDPSAITQNTRALGTLLEEQTALMAVVKADGYGHGMLTAARAAIEGGATWLGVAHPASALALARADLDAVIIAVPSGLHAEVTIQALDADKHVFLEKPIEVTVAAADRIRAAEQRSGKVLTIASQRRFAAENQFLKQIIEEGRLGRITSATIEVPLWRSQEYYDSGAWRGTWELDGGGALIVQELAAVLGEKAGITDLNRIYTRDEMVTADVIFSATGVTNGSIVRGLRREPTFIETETILMRSKTGSVRRMFYRNPIKRA